VTSTATVSAGTRKTSLRDHAASFQETVDEVVAFAARASEDQTDQDVTWIHEYAIIRLFREFEGLMLNAIAGAINNDSSVLSGTLGIRFPVHLAHPVCEYIVTGGGYFDFRGRDGLIKDMKKLLGDGHWLLTIVRKQAYRQPLDQLIALRNFAAHDSEQSRTKAKESVGFQRLAAAGAWLKRQGRLTALATRLKALASEIEAAAPY